MKILYARMGRAKPDRMVGILAVLYSVSLPNFVVGENLAGKSVSSMLPQAKKTFCVSDRVPRVNKRQGLYHYTTTYIGST